MMLKSNNAFLLVAILMAAVDRAMSTDMDRELEGIPVDAYFCDCGCGDDIIYSSVWVGDTNDGLYDPTNPTQDEDDAGVHYSLECLPHTDIFELLYNGLDATCDDSCFCDHPSAAGQANGNAHASAMGQANGKAHTEAPSQAPTDIHIIGDICRRHRSLCNRRKLKGSWDERRQLNGDCIDNDNEDGNNNGRGNAYAKGKTDAPSQAPTMEPDVADSVCKGGRGLC